MRDKNLCLNLNCPGDHKQQIDYFYENLVNYMILATKFAENEKIQIVNRFRDGIIIVDRSLGKHVTVFYGGLLRVKSVLELYMKT